MFRGCGSNLNLFVVLCFFVVVGVQRTFWRCTASNALTVVWGRWFSVVWVKVFTCALYRSRNDLGLGSEKGNG